MTRLPQGPVVVALFSLLHIIFACHFLCVNRNVGEELWTVSADGNPYEGTEWSRVTGNNGEVYMYHQRSGEASKVVSVAAASTTTSTETIAPLTGAAFVPTNPKLAGAPLPLDTWQTSEVVISIGDSPARCATKTSKKKWLSKLRSKGSDLKLHIPTVSDIESGSQPAQRIEAGGAPPRTPGERTDSSGSVVSSGKSTSGRLTWFSRGKKKNRVKEGKKGEVR